MGKIRTRKILFVVAAMLLCVLVAVLIRLFFSNRIVRMTLTPIEVCVLYGFGSFLFFVLLNS